MCVCVCVCAWKRYTAIQRFGISKIFNVSFAHQGCIYLIKKYREKNCNIVKYYYNLKQQFSIYYTLKYNLLLWCKAEFSSTIIPVFSVT